MFGHLEFFCGKLPPTECRHIQELSSRMSTSFSNLATGWNVHLAVHLEFTNLWDNAGPGSQELGQRSLIFIMPWKICSKSHQSPKVKILNVFLSNSISYFDKSISRNKSHIMLWYFRSRKAIKPRCSYTSTSKQETTLRLIVIFKTAFTTISRRPTIKFISF